jgi:ankyrin repeat protein
LLQRGADPSASGDSIAPLALAVWVENTDAIKELLHAGANVNAATTDAVAGLNETALSLLLSKGADPNLADEEGLRPLQIAAMVYAGNDRLAGLLLNAGADPNAKDPEGHTPLELARIHGNKPVEMLLTKTLARHGPPSQDVFGQN